jgi:gas vesicle protein
MNTLELKNSLKLQIDSINDKKLLNAIFVLLESKTNEVIYLSDKQKEEIKQAQREYKEGNHIENNFVNEEIEKWLLEK